MFCYWPHESTERLTYTGADWVKRYALAKSKLLLAEVWMKYSGAIPGPAQNIQLDQQKRQQAVDELEKLTVQLHGMQTSTAVSID